MKRRNACAAVLAALFTGKAKGQQAKPREFGVEDVQPFDRNVKDREILVPTFRDADYRQVVPDKCPVCGAMADPYVRKVYPAGTVVPCDTDPSKPLVCLLDKAAPQGPMERLTRCKRCSVAFWQDATE